MTASKKDVEYWGSRYKGFAIGMRNRGADGIFTAQGIQFENGVLILDKGEKSFKKKSELLSAKGRKDVDVFGPFKTNAEAVDAARFGGRDRVKVLQNETGMSSADMAAAQRVVKELAASAK